MQETSRKCTTITLAHNSGRFILGSRLTSSPCLWLLKTSHLPWSNRPVPDLLAPKVILDLPTMPSNNPLNGEQNFTWEGHRALSAHLILLLAGLRFASWAQPFLIGFFWRPTDSFCPWPSSDTLVRALYVLSLVPYNSQMGCTSSWSFFIPNAEKPPSHRTISPK